MSPVLDFATTTPPIPVTVDTFVRRNVKRNDSSAFRDDFRLFRLSGMSDPPRTLANACERLRALCEHLRTLCEHNATSSRRLLDPWTPTLTRKPFCYAFGKKMSLFVQMPRTLSPELSLKTSPSFLKLSSTCLSQQVDWVELRYGALVEAGSVAGSALV